MNATQTPRAPHAHPETSGSDVNPDQQQKAPLPENTPRRLALGDDGGYRS
jgi:hypothetical protein